MWSVKAIVLLLYCYGCLSAHEERPYFTSRNFNNTLHWEHVKNKSPGEEVLYSVQYWSHSEDQPHHIKLECDNITALSCDLTAETPPISDVHYFAEVFANGRPHGRTYRFKPIAHTVLGPPILSKRVTVSSLLLNVTLPSGPNGISIADIFNSSKRLPFNPTTLYILNITQPKWAAQVNTSTTGQFVIDLKNNNTEYCGHVVYKPNFELGRNHSENASFCVTLPDDPWMLFPWFLMLALVLVVMAVVSIVYMCYYVKGGKEKSMPQFLVTHFSIMPSVLQSPDKDLFFSKPEVCPKNYQRVYNNIQVKPNVASVASGGYSPQDIPCQGLPGDSGSSIDMILHRPGPEHQDVSGQSSENYGAVLVHVPAEEPDAFAANEDIDGISSQWSSLLRREKQDTGGTSPKLTPPLPIVDSQQGHSVMLRTERDVNGQLIFPMFTFQSQSVMAGTGSPPKPEGKPLLSDLLQSRDSLGDSEWSDSGCEQSAANTPTQLSCTSQDSPTQALLPASPPHYQKTQTGRAVLASGYQQNWMPAHTFGITPEDCDQVTNFVWNCTETKKEEQEEEEDEEENPRHIFLEGWAVQIQE